MPILYVIAGCNGAGKTTASFTLLPEIINCQEFVNADNIASGISPFNAEKAGFEAGRIMLERIHELARKKVTFAFETTLATKSYAPFVKKAQRSGYEVCLLFFWIQSPEIAKERVAARVSKGGHNISPDVIERRYYRGIKNLINLYLPICNRWLIVNNMETTSQLIAHGKKELQKVILNTDIWDSIIKQRYVK